MIDPYIYNAGFANGAWDKEHDTERYCWDDRHHIPLSYWLGYWNGRERSPF